MMGGWPRKDERGYGDRPGPSRITFQLHGVDVSGNMALCMSNARYVAEPASIPALLSSVYCATAALEV
jgi:hypothetical protein